MADNKNVRDGDNSEFVGAAQALGDGSYAPKVAMLDGSGSPTPIAPAQAIVDNAPFTDGTTKVTPAGFILDEVAGTALTENDAGAARIDSKRAQVLVIEDATTRGRRATVTAAGAIAVEIGADGTVGTTFATTKALSNAAVSASSSGDNTAIAGTATQTIRVNRLYMVAAGAVNVTLKDGTGTPLTGAIPMVANQVMHLDFSGGEPWFVTSAGNGFVINLSGAVAVTGFVQYTKS